MSGQWAPLVKAASAIACRITERPAHLARLKLPPVLVGLCPLRLNFWLPVRSFEPSRRKPLKDAPPGASLPPRPRAMLWLRCTLRPVDSARPLDATLLCATGPSSLMYLQ